MSFEENFIELNYDKEREAFESNGIAKEYGVIRMNAGWSAWQRRAEIAQAEEKKLQDKITELQQKLAQYENPDYVLVPRNPTNAMISAGQDNEDRQLYHYEVSSVWGKMIEEVEKSK